MVLHLVSAAAFVLTVPVQILRHSAVHFAHFMPAFKFENLHIYYTYCRVESE